MKILKEEFRLSLEETSLKKATLVVFTYKNASGMIYEHDIFLRETIKAYAMKVCFR